MKKLKAILYLCILSVFISCDKDDYVSQTFVRSDFVEGKVKMYTNNGVVEDNEIINDFIARNNFRWIYDENAQYDEFFDSDKDIFNRYDLEIKFSSDNEGEIDWITDGKELSYKFHLQRKESYTNISMHDTIIYNTNGELVLPLLKCAPEVIEESQLPITSGFKKSFKLFKTLHVKEVDNEIHVYHCLVANHSYYDDALRSLSVYLGGNNMINEDDLRGLSSKEKSWKDTVVYKESYIRFVVK
ncbi:hypothetical protein [Marinifilum flexuosum]|nr:hypothetical protein [Marinifilum flexuosum]